MDLLTSLIRPRAASSIEEMILSSVPTLSLAGTRVTSETALRISAVWACTRLIANSLASIPVITYRRRADGGKERAEDHPLYDVLHRQSNHTLSAFELKRLLTMRALLQGNGYARILPGPRGPVDRLVPLLGQVEVEQVDEDRVRYRVYQPGRAERVLNDDEVFHLRGLSWDGLTGVSVIEYARESMGLALATESHGARQFSQGASLSGILSHPGKLTNKAAQGIRADWEAQHNGLHNAHSVAVFAEGIQFTPTSMSNQDAQFLATREFQVADIARWFGVDLTLIQENTKATSWGSGIEQLLQAFVAFTLLPWARLWEEAIARDLILAPQVYFAEYQLNSLVRGDLKTRMESYEIAIRSGIKSRNEIRKLENDNPVPGLDGYDKPLNIGDATSPTSTAPASRSAHYRRLVEETAVRVVRKEVSALGRAAKRAESAEEWAVAVEEFYGDHGRYVAEALAIPASRAELYATAQQLTLLERGPAAVADWLPGRAEALIKLVLEVAA